MDIKKTARTLSTITQEQWESILILLQQDAASFNNIESIPNSQEERAGNILKLIGVTPYSMGYNYFIEAILLKIGYPSITKKESCLKIAKKHNTTRGAVGAALDRETKKVDSKEIGKLGLKSDQIKPYNIISAIANYIQTK